MLPVKLEAQCDSGIEQILGLGFFDGSAREAVEEMRRSGGYIVVPAAPALVNIRYDEAYRRALTQADLAIADSGFMVSLWRVIRRRPVNRISGLVYLQELLRALEQFPPESIFLLVPTEAAGEKATAWFSSEASKLVIDSIYVAPKYGSHIVDESLLERLNSRQPKHVIIGLGGGTQERLGLYLREHVRYRPAIHCIGAALGFVTGDQKSIPDWADRYYLGWLLRLMRNPRVYFRRFWMAHELPWLIFKYGSRLPPMVPGK